MTKGCRVHIVRFQDSTQGGGIVGYFHRRKAGTGTKKKWGCPDKSTRGNGKKKTDYPSPGKGHA